MTPDKLLRRSISLDGEWEFSFEGPTASLGGDARITTPSLWQTQFPALRNAPGVGRYRREVTLPGEWSEQSIHLVIEGVFHEATVLVDERPVGSHRDGWTTCDLDLTQALAGKSKFSLGVDAILPDERGLGSAALGETFIAKQDWYGLQGGVWKPARLEARSPRHIAALAVQTMTEGVASKVTARGALSGAAADTRLRLTLRRDGAVVAQTECGVNGEAFVCELPIASAELWSPDSPTLYEFECALVRKGQVVDVLIRSVGFRQFEARDGRLFLNGAPFQMFGALDQDWHPEQECRAPTPEFLEQRFRNAKAMGLNTLRCHVKIPDKLYFELADRIGLLVWLDMPYCEYLTPQARETIGRVFSGSVAEHAHHPSICIWTLFNEGWGIDLDDNPDDRRWLIAFFDAAKAAVPESLVVDNSPCFPRNYHVKTDIEDFHWYNGFPHQNAAFRSTTEAFARGADFSWSPHGDAQRRDDAPRICSEFGVWGLPHVGDILEKDGREPWWFESGHDWNGGAAYPHGVATRFRDAGLAAAFGDLDHLVDAAQEFQFRGLKAQIEALRWEPRISGYVITELNDVQWEANGLMDARNNPRRFADRLASLQTPWLVMARTTRTALACGERFDVELRLVGPTPPPPGARIVWRCLAATGEIPAGEAPSTVTLTAPAEPGVVDLELLAHASDGRLLSRNRLELCILPSLVSASTLAPLDPEAARMLSLLNWPSVAPADDLGATLVATRLTGAVRQKLLAGRHVILVANEEQALLDPERRITGSDRHNFPRMNLRKRDGAPWDGRWMGAFAWRRTDGVWAKLPGGAMIDEHWVGLTPNFVLTDFLSTSYSGLVDSGIVVAWLHAAAAAIKRTRLGAGSLTVATYDFSTPEALANPIAPHLLSAIAGS